MKIGDLQKISNLVRERREMQQNIEAIEDATDFYVKDKAGRISGFQLEVGPSYLREPLLRWAKAELLLIEGALEALGVELQP